MFGQSCATKKYCFNQALSLEIVHLSKEKWLCKKSNHNHCFVDFLDVVSFQPVFV